MSTSGKWNLFQEHNLRETGRWVCLSCFFLYTTRSVAPGEVLSFVRTSNQQNKQKSQPTISWVNDANIYFHILALSSGICKEFYRTDLDFSSCKLACQASLWGIINYHFMSLCVLIHRCLSFFILKILKYPHMPPKILTTKKYLWCINASYILFSTFIYVWIVYNKSCWLQTFFFIEINIDRYLLMEKMAKCLCVCIGKILEITDKTLSDFFNFWEQEKCSFK